VPVALVTGSFARVADLGMALKRVGFSVTELVAVDRLDEVCVALGPGSVDCYAQLPWDFESSAPTALERLGDVLVQDLGHRFQAVARVLPLLRPDACVVLAAGHLHVHAVRLLARMIRDEEVGAGIRAVTVEDGCPADDMAAIVRHRGPDLARRIAEFAALEEGSSFADWRREVLSRWR
jgi:hypothetical protein